MINRPMYIDKIMPYAVRSINSMLASLNSLLTFLGWAECKVKSIKQQKQVYCAEEKELTKAEYMRLLDAAKNNRQLQLVMEAICSTGIRVSELRFFTVEAVQQGEVVVNCKGKTRTILIPGKLRKLLLDYAKKEKIRSGVIFITRNGRPLNRSCIWAQMKALCVEAGVNPSKVFPHNLRKLFARTFYGIEKDIAKLADILGHSSIDTTRIYIMTTGTEHHDHRHRTSQKDRATWAGGIGQKKSPNIIHIMLCFQIEMIFDCLGFDEFGRTKSHPPVDFFKNLHRG